MVRTVTMRELEVFFHLGEQHTFTATGQALGGIDQSAVSKHIAQLESKLGGRRLHDRETGTLTTEGRLLHRFLRPFFVGLPAMLARITRGNTPALKIDASNFVFESCFGPALTELMAAFPRLALALRTPRAHEIAARLRSRESDFAIAVCDAPPAGLDHLSLLSLRLALLVPADSPIVTLDDLRTHRHLCGPVLCPLREDVVTRHFLSGCDSLGLKEPELCEVEAVALVPYLSATLKRMGVCVDYPPLYADRSVRLLPLPKFPPLHVMALFRRQRDEVLAFLLEVVTRHSTQLKRDLALAALERKQVAVVNPGEVV